MSSQYRVERNELTPLAVRLTIFTACLLVLLLCFSAFVYWWIPLVVGPFLLVFFLALFLSERVMVSVIRVTVILYVLGGLLAAIGLPPADPRMDKARNAEVAQNLYAIQLALERYAVDHAGYYPSDFTSAQLEDYLPKNPQNPYWQKYYAPSRYWEKETEADDRRMRSIDLADSQPLGNFSYQPQLVVVNGEQVAVGYDLFAFGKVPPKSLADPSDECAFNVIHHLAGQRIVAESPDTSGDSNGAESAGSPPADPQ